MRVLYVEDEQYLADAVIHILKKSNIIADHAKDGAEGLELATKPIYDVIILDIMLPKMSGVDILMTIRKRKIKTPVIMLSALSQAEDKVNSLNSGADDYLAKPFKAAELIARINALARRPALLDDNIIKFRDITYDLQNRTLNGLTLTEKEALILESLIKNPTNTQSKEYLLAHIWGEDGETNYIEVYVSYLRKKLRQLNCKTTIKTIRGLGYKLVKKETK